MTRHPPLKFAKITVLLSLLSVLLCTNAAWAQSVSQQKSQDYFVRQSANEDLFIRISGYEAEVRSTVSTQEGQIFMISDVSGSRLLPVFQYIDAPDNDRQLDITVSSGRFTGRSEFSLELTRLQIWDERSRAVSRAYRMLASAMIKSSDTSAASWTVKIDSLINAGRLFQQFGMTEMQLWSNYLAAHLVHHQLRDYSIAYTMSAEILDDLKGARVRNLELATLQLQSAALIGLKRAGVLSTTASDRDPVQTSLAKVISLAKATGYELEQALALQASGEAYAEDAYYTEALERFKNAVAISDSIADGELATEIRESMVEIHALEGDTKASSQVLQEIETQLQDEGEEDDLALNLLAQGRIFLRNYQYDLALESFSRALEYQNDSAVRLQINFEMARCFFEAGRLEEALSYLNLVGISTPAAQQSRRGTIIDPGEGYAILAAIHRINGEFDLMRQARESQGAFHSGRASYLYQRGLDEVAANGENSRAAWSLLRQGYETSAQSGDRDLQDLSRLQFCALQPSDQALCRQADTQISYQRLSESGIPRYASQAMYLRARIWVALGQRGNAITLMDSLIDEIHMLRSQLPGVLGTWYRERHEHIFDFYLDLLSRAGNERGGRDGLASLLALSKIRYIEESSSTASFTAEAAQTAESLRNRLAQLEQTSAAQRSSELKLAVDIALSELRNRSARQLGSLSENGIQTFLNKLKKNEVLLTYHISPTTAQVWVAGKSGIKHKNIANPAYIYAALDEARQGLANVGLNSFDSKMDALGKRLIAPVADLLKETVYWVPAGPLLGFPLDALRWNSRYLVENHTLVNLWSFPQITALHQKMDKPARQNVFLAGYPQDYIGEYATSLETSAEIQTVTDIFVGPGLTIVQGAALLPDEFGTEKFTGAGLIHLAIPGTINLRYPEQSFLELSGFEGGTGRARLYPYDILPLGLRAELVFLSATQVKQQPTSAFISHPGFVSAFFEAGAQSVIARLWTTGGSVPQVLLQDFYRELERSGDAAEALAVSKRRYMESNRKDGLYDWAGFQLFAN